MTDDELCKALEGTGETQCSFVVYTIKRGGVLLLGLPADAKAARATLALYHPQAMLARAMVIVMSCLIPLGLHRWLLKRRIEIKENGPLSARCNQANVIGFLLGTHETDNRRAIVLYLGKVGYEVEKMGFGESARLSVLDEGRIIESLPEDHMGIPKLLSIRDEDDWASYTTLYLVGRSPSTGDAGNILSLLRDWMDRSTTQRFDKTSQWLSLREFAESSKDDEVKERWRKLKKVAGLEIKVGLFHGDFAPWNIKVMGDGSMVVMDWEHASLMGPLGWDWLHYMVQYGLLVEKLPLNEVEEKCRRWANSEDGQVFLKQAGWLDHEEEWIQSYLMYSGWVLGFDR